MTEYAYQVMWSDEHGDFVAQCIDIPGLYGVGGTKDEAVRECKVAVSGWLGHLRSTGQPEPRSSGAMVIELAAGGDFAV